MTDSAVRARSFAGGTGLVVWRSAGCGTALAGTGGRVALPVSWSAGLEVRDPSGRAVPTLHTPGSLVLVMVAGRPYTLQRSGSAC